MLLLSKHGETPVYSVKKYLTQDRVLVIPPWQREYEWSAAADGEVQQLLTDLRDFVLSNDEDYLLGSVIMCQDVHETGLPKVLLIDGQQRSLTLSIFLMCAIKHLKTANLVDGGNIEQATLMTDLANAVTRNPLGRFEPRVSMNQGKANEILASIYDWALATSEDWDQGIFKSSDTQTVTQQNLTEVARHIYKQFSEDAWLPRNEFLAGVSRVMKDTRLVELALTNQSQAIAVFDRINNRGRSLSSADLIKNMLFQQVDESNFVDISASWQTMSETLHAIKQSRLQDPKYLLRATAGIDSGTKLTYDSLVKHWTDEFKAGLSPLDFSDRLVAQSTSLAQFAGSHASDIYLAGALGAVQHFPVLLAASEAKFDATDVEAAIRKQVGARTLVYILGGERTQAFESMVPKWARAVKDLGSSATVAQLKDVYAEVAVPDEDLWASLEKSVRSLSYSNASDRKRIRAILAMLSAKLGNTGGGMQISVADAMSTKKIAVTLTDIQGVDVIPGKAKKQTKQAWDLEHIRAQSLDKSPFFQTIGNLVLLAPPDNRAASNAEPSAKRIYFNQSILNLTKSLGRLEDLTDATQGAIRDAYAMAQKGAATELSLAWDLDSWGYDDVAARTDFYVGLLKYLLANP